MNNTKEVITRPYSGLSFKVKLTYFQASGKYYSEGQYVSDKLHLTDIWAELREMFRAGHCPGLFDGVNEFYTVVEVPEHPHNHLTLIMPDGAA